MLAAVQSCFTKITHLCVFVFTYACAVMSNLTRYLSKMLSVFLKHSAHLKESARCQTIPRKGLINRNEKHFCE